MIWALNSDPFRKPFSLLFPCSFVIYFRPSCRYNFSWIWEQQAALPEAVVDTRVGGIGRQAFTIQIYVYVCMYIYIYSFIYTCVRVYIYIFIYNPRRIFMKVHSLILESFWLQFGRVGHSFGIFAYLFASFLISIPLFSCTQPFASHLPFWAWAEWLWLMPKSTSGWCPTKILATPSYGYKSKALCI